MFHVTESNKLEGLCHSFKQIAFQKGKNPFTKRIVLVPSTAFKTYLKMDMASDPQIGIAFGLDILTYEEGLVHLSHLFLKSPAKREVPTLLELTMRIQAELLALMKNSCPHILTYVHGSKDSSSEKKLYLLAKSLARLFLNYGRFDPAVIQGESDNFQTSLFKKIFNDPSRWTTRIDALSWPLNDLTPQNFEIFVFAPYMTKAEVDFLKKISAQVSVELFSMTPTSCLLDDHLTDREEKRSPHPFEKNPFIANYSMLYRETQKNIIDSTDQVSNIYLVDSFSSLEDDWKSLIRNEHILVGSSKPTLLKAFQTDLTLMRLPEKKLEIQEQNPSIEFHITNTRFREIQTLYNQIISLMERQAIKPMDIQVFAKDILPYEPYIKAVFGKQSSPLNYTIQGEKASKPVLVQAFLNLLSFKRFESAMITSLLEYSLFRKKWGFSAKDVQTIRSYFEEESFTWGENLDYKNAYFYEKGFEKGAYDTLSAGTKENFEKRLLERFIKESSIDISESDMIAALLTLLGSLEEDLSILSSRVKQTLADWSRFLKKLLYKYFEIAKTTSEEQESILFLEKKIDSLLLTDPIVLETPCLFTTVFCCLKDALNKGMSRDKDEDLNTIRFSSLLPHHASPSKAIALIGLAPGVFPARDSYDSLDLLKKNASVKLPKNSDIDRFLFMETLLSARDFLYLSLAKTDDDETPSMAVSDLFQYLDMAFTVNGKLPSEACTFKHPKTHYDPSYFIPGGKINYSEIHYKECLASLKPPQMRSIIHKNEHPHLDKINIRDLVNFLRNPLKTYLQKGLGLYLPEHEGLGSPLEFPKADYYNLERSFLNDVPESDFIKKAEMLASMPPKLFRDLEMQKIVERRRSLLSGLKNIGLSPADLSSLNLVPYSDYKASYSNPHHHYPGISLGKTLVFGVIENVSDQGIVRTLGSNPLKDLLTACLESAVLRLIGREHAILLMNEKNTVYQIPHNYLDQVVDLYLEGLKRPLLLLPSFLQSIKNRDSQKLENEILKAFNPFKETRDSKILQWAYGKGNSISAKKLIEELQSKAEVLLKPFEDIA